MTIKVKAGALCDALKACDAVGKLENASERAAIEASGGMMTVRSTDLISSVRVTLPCKGEGAFCVTRAALKQISGFGAAEDVLTIAQNDTLKIELPSARYEIGTLKADSFPPFPEPETDWFELAGEDLSRALAATASLASTELTCPYICGVWLVASEDLKFVATNRFALAEITIPKPRGCELLGEYLIPTEALPAIRAMASKGDVRLALDDARVFVEHGNRELVSQLIDTQIFNYARLFPERKSNKVTVHRADFEGALQRAMFGNADDPSVLFEVEGSTGTLSAAGSQSTYATADFPVEADADCEVGLNGNDLTSYFATITPAPDQIITMWVNGPAAPVPMSLGGAEALRIVFMPRRTLRKETRRAA